MANLVLNGKSIDNIDDIAENFAEAEVLREFQSGSLAAWLEEYGYEEELERVRSIKQTASSIRILSGIIDALNLDDGVIAQANARREEQQRKKEAIQKAHEEQQRKEEEEQLRREDERKRREQEGLQRQEVADRHQTHGEECVTIMNTFDHFRKLAEQGAAIAQYNLGVCYYKGDGVAEDKREAVKWYRKAAEQGLADAQYYLGTCYYGGVGIAEDKREAVKWYRKAAEQGHVEAQYSLGVCYYKGTDVAEDKHRQSRDMFMRNTTLDSVTNVGTV